LLKHVNKQPFFEDCSLVLVNFFFLVSLFLAFLLFVKKLTSNFAKNGFEPLPSADETDELPCCSSLQKNYYV
jgi:hypothetical protein